LDARRPVCHPGAVIAVATGLSWVRLGINEGTALAFVGIREWTFEAPTLLADTIHVEQSVQTLRPSRSKPDRGVVDFDVAVVNANGVVQQRGLWTLLWARRPA
jgi:acyl dehydratase